MTLATTLPGEAASVPAARRFVQSALEGMGLHAAWDAAQLPLSELVSNCVIHAQTPLTVTVVCTGDVVRISVEDHSVALPRQRNYGTESTTGRGLRLVDTVATAGESSSTPAASRCGSN